MPKGPDPAIPTPLTFKGFIYFLVITAQAAIYAAAGKSMDTENLFDKKAMLHNHKRASWDCLLTATFTLSNAVVFPSWF